VAETKAPNARPLSPHLQVYRLTMTMAMSIVHRITGAGLYFGTLLFVWWLFAAATSRGFEALNGFFATWFGQLLLFGYSWALIHHMLGGVRHLIWDTGRALGPTEREFLSWATLVGSVSLTVLVWLFGLMLRG
jgi:succinate dehydrogenase / fumarate reductase, cytochrome b subunit